MPVTRETEPETDRPTAEPATGPPPEAVTLWPMPEARHVYLLAAGIVLGVLLGPAVMGRVLPAQHDRWFSGGGPDAQLEQAHAQAQQLLQQPEAYLLPPEIEAGLTRYETLANDAMDRRLATLASIEATPQAALEERERSTRAITDYRAGVTKRAIDARLNQQLLYIAGLERELERQRHAHHLKLVGIQLTLILALIAFAIAEALLAPPAGAGRRAVSPRLAHLITIRYALLAGWLTLTLAQPVALRQVNPLFAGLLVAVVLVVGLVPLGKRADTDHAGPETV